MRITINRLKWIFLGIFALCCAGIWAYQLLWVVPRDQCNDRQGWWDGRTRVCAQPIYIPDLTGRQPGESREAASIRRQAEQAQIARRARGEDVAPLDPATPTDPATPATPAAPATPQG